MLTIEQVQAWKKNDNWLKGWTPINDSDTAPICYGDWKLDSGFVTDGRSDSSVQAAAGLTGKAGFYSPYFKDVRDALGGCWQMVLDYESLRNQDAHECDGKCEEHVSPIRKVIVHGFQGGPLDFHYCQEAIKHDTKHGFFVEVCD